MPYSTFDDPNNDLINKNQIELDELIVNYNELFNAFKDSIKNNTSFDPSYNSIKNEYDNAQGNYDGKMMTYNEAKDNHRINTDIVDSKNKVSSTAEYNLTIARNEQKVVKDAFDAATTAKQIAEAAKVAAQIASDNAIIAYNSAVLAIGVETSRTAITNADTNLTTKNTALTATQNAVTSAQNLYNTALTDYNNKVQLAGIALNVQKSKLAELDAAIAVTSAANDAKIAAETNYTNLLNSISASPAAKAAALEIKNTKVAAYTLAFNKQALVQSQLGTANSNLNTANTAKANAQQTLTTMLSDLNAKKATLATAISAQQDAASGKAAAITYASPAAVAARTATAVAAEKAKINAKTILDTTIANLIKPTADLITAQENLTKANLALSVATGASATAKNELASAITIANQTQTILDTAASQMQAAEKIKSDKLQIYNEMIEIYTENIRNKRIPVDELSTKIKIKLSEMNALIKTLMPLETNNRSSANQKIKNIRDILTDLELKNAQINNMTPAEKKANEERAKDLEDKHIVSSLKTDSSYSKYMLYFVFMLFVIAGLIYIYIVPESGNLDMFMLFVGLIIIGYYLYDYITIKIRNN